MDCKENNLRTMPQLLDFFQKNMQYGFTHQGKVYQEGPDFWRQMNQYYQLKTEADFIQSGHGVCWDFCEFERYFCEQRQIPHACYFFLSFLNRDEGGPTHTFLLFNQNEKWYWFEYAWQAYRGIWEYPNKQAALADIMAKFCQANDRPYAKVDVYQTTKAPAGLNAGEFVEHCLRGEKIDLLTAGATATNDQNLTGPELAR